MTKKTFTKGQKIKFIATTIIFLSLLIIALGEIGVRLFTEDPVYFKKSDVDDEIGWLSKENYQDTYKMGSKGNDILYNVVYRTGKDGFRLYGDVNTTKPKVLFVGDSYVQSVEVSNDKTFYSLLEDSLGIEAFAYGQAGYGTLQQKLIIDRFKNDIQPDLIVLQTCDNDYIDNHAPLEYNSVYKVGLRRPYYDVDGNLIYRRAMPWWQEFVDKSKFLGLIRKKLQNVAPIPPAEVAQKRMSEEGRKFKEYDEAVIVTQAIMRDMKSSAGDIPIIAWSASAYQPMLSDFKMLSEAEGIPFYEHPGLNIYELVKVNEIVNSSDGYHWNEVGQQKIAEYLIEPISSALDK